MPDIEGKLTKEEQDRIKIILEKYAPGTSAICPICSRQDWVIGQHMVSAIPVNPGIGYRLGGTAYPKIMLMSPCGYTMFVNAVYLGIAAPYPSETPKKY